MSRNPLGWLAALEAVAILVLVAVLLTREPASAPVTPTGGKQASGVQAPASPEASTTERPKAKAEEAAAEREALDPRPPVQPSDRVLLYGTVSAAHGDLTDDRVSLSVRVPGSSRSISGAVSPSRDYSVPGLPHGKVRLLCRAKGFKLLERELELGPEPIQRVDLVLEASREVRVYLVDDGGQDVQAALYRAGGSSSDLWVTATTSREPPSLLPMTYNGRTSWGSTKFRRNEMRMDKDVPKDCFGVLEVEGFEPMVLHVMLRNVALASAELPPTADEVRVPVDVGRLASILGRVHGRILDPSGAAPPKGHCSLSNRQSMRGLPLEPDGSFAVDRLAPGYWTLKLWTESHAWTELAFLLEPGQDLDLGAFRLEPKTGVAGKVVDQDGKPVVAKLSFLRLAPHLPGALSPGVEFGESDGTGGFATDRAGRGRYILTAKTENGLGWVGFDTSAGPVDGLLVRVTKQREVQPVNRLGPADQRLLEVLTTSGMPVYTRDVDASWRWPIRLPEGDYLVRLHRVEGPPLEDRLHVGPDGGTITLR